MEEPKTEGSELTRKWGPRCFFVFLLLVVLLAGVQIAWIFKQQEHAQQREKLEEQKEVAELHKELLRQAELLFKLAQRSDTAEDRFQKIEEGLHALAQRLGQSSLDVAEKQLLSSLETLRLAAFYTTHQHDKTKARKYLGEFLEILKQSDFAHSERAFIVKTEQAIQALDQVQVVDKLAIWKTLGQQIEYLNALVLKIPRSYTPKDLPFQPIQKSKRVWWDWHQWKEEAQAAFLYIGSLIRVRDHSLGQPYSTLEDRAFYLRTAQKALLEAQMALVSGETFFFQPAIEKAIAAFKFSLLWDPELSDSIQSCEALAKTSFKEEWPELAPLVMQLDQLLAKKIGYTE